jgi:hypothetical protein
MWLENAKQRAMTKTLHFIWQGNEHCVTLQGATAAISKGSAL